MNKRHVSVLGHRPKSAAHKKGRGDKMCPPPYLFGRTVQRSAYAMVDGEFAPKKIGWCVLDIRKTIY